MTQEIIERQRAAMAEAGMEARARAAAITERAGLSEAGVPTKTTLYD